MTIDEIREKYGVSQNDGKIIVPSKIKAQKAVDRLFAACNQARVAVSEFNREVLKNTGGKILDTVDFDEVLDFLKRGAKVFKL